MSPARATKSLCFGYVSETYQNTTNELISLTLFDSQTGATETLEVTPGHPFWVSETAASSGEAGNPVRRSLGEGGWTFAGELAEGDELTSATGHALTVTAVKHTQRDAATFNFAVSHVHTYFVGSTSTWTHNTSQPVTNFEVGTMGDLHRRSVTGDNLQRHELLQHAWLEEHGHVTAGRGSNPISRNNPAIMLTDDMHKSINKLQSSQGLHDKSNLRAMSAKRNIYRNAAIMRKAGVPKGQVQALRQKALTHAKASGCK